MKKPLVIGGILLIAGVVAYMVYQDYQKKKKDNNTVSLDEALKKIAESKLNQ
jgi:predicted negative regulator of RcsB-dependent stress response